jgi:peptidoglycan/LPS O-acetylase OafA/YrhL
MIPSLNYWRAIAILLVISYHYFELPYGYLGVDIFFVLSGFLVSRKILSDFVDGAALKPWEFIRRRALRILPSYYVFLIFGNLIAFVLYRESEPDFFINLSHLPRYLFFFQNYRGTPHYIFDHIWSLCVEEHFYFSLPLILLLMGKLCPPPKRRHFLGYSLILFIVFGNLCRIIGFEVGFETFSSTHSRMDALAWGVLLAWLEKNGSIHKDYKTQRWLGIFGMTGISGLIWLHQNSSSIFYHEVAFLGLCPPFISLLILSTISFKTDKLWFLQKISRVSFNWYLWHLLFYYFILQKLVLKIPLSILCLLQILVSFAVATFFTRVIEEPILNRYRQPKAKTGFPPAFPAHAV